MTNSPARQTEPLCDVAIIGGGPAGLSAALVLGRCRRNVIVFDHGHGRNYAAVHMHGFLGHDGITPARLRELGRREAESYGVKFVEAEVEGVCACSDGRHNFEIQVPDHPTVRARKLLLATGVRDKLPDVENIRDFYGRSVHHCPYCDGWEHRDERLVALGDGVAAVGLALGLRTWSSTVVACVGAGQLTPDDHERARQNNIAVRPGRPLRMEGREGRLERIHFHEGPPLECDALFFNSHQTQRSRLPIMLGCKCDDAGLILTEGKQTTGVISRVDEPSLQSCASRASNSRPGSCGYPHRNSRGPAAPA
jgi:thioredoxin reductase